MNPYVELGIAVVAIGLVAFGIGFYVFQRRFWAQDRNRSRTAPSTPDEGVGKLGDSAREWQPPRAS